MIPTTARRDIPGGEVVPVSISGQWHGRPYLSRPRRLLVGRFKHGGQHSQLGLRTTRPAARAIRPRRRSNAGAVPLSSPTKVHVLHRQGRESRPETPQYTDLQQSMRPDPTKIQLDRF